MKKFSFALLLILLLTLGSCTGGAPAAQGETETEAPVPDVVLVENGATDFTIVRYDMASSAETEASMLLRKALTAAGLKIKIQTDWEGEPVNAHEIVVGNSTRLTDAGLNVRDAGDSGYICLAKDGKIYLSGMTADKTKEAVTLFLTEFFGYTGDPETVPAASSVVIPGNYDRSVLTEYPVTSFTLDGKDVHEYAIVIPDVKSKPQKAAAELLRDAIYNVSGAFLEIVSEGEPGSRILFEPVAAGENFTVSFRDGDLVVRSGFTNTVGNQSEFSRGLHTFIAQTLENAKGTIAMDKNYSLKVDVMKEVTYKEFGAVGDGVHDDLAAVIAAHEYANAHNLPVKGDAGATFYFGAHTTTAVIGTDTDWTGCKFIFDDSNQPVDKRSTRFFHVRRTDGGTTLKDLGVTTLKKGQTKIETTTPLDKNTDYYVTLANSNVKQFIREGANQNDGTAQTDCFILHGDGTVDSTTPIIWDFDVITSSNVYKIEKTPLTIKGGEITTIANQAESKYTYYTTNILIERSNTHVTGLKHYVTGELDHGAPYDGIIQVNYCANVTVEDCLLTAHYIYRTIGSAGTGVSMGTYDLRQRSAINVTYRNCSQTTDILDTKYWGIFVSDFCKNLVLENCTFSRFDAHMGVTNATLKGCTLGHQCINAIGHGLLTVEDCTLYGQNIIQLRGDYGSTWNGDVVIRNCTWIPNKGQTITSNNINVISGSYSGFHDFGYECYMPKNVTIDGLLVKDSNSGGGYTGVCLLGNISSQWTSENYEYKVEQMGFPYHVTETITISGFKSETGKNWTLSTNRFMYRNVTIIEK